MKRTLLILGILAGAVLVGMVIRSSRISTAGSPGSRQSLVVTQNGTVTLVPGPREGGDMTVVATYPVPSTNSAPPASAK